MRSCLFFYGEKVVELRKFSYFQLRFLNFDEFDSGFTTNISDNLH